MNEISFTINDKEYFIPKEMKVKHYQEIAGKELLLEGNKRDIHILNILTGCPIKELKKINHSELKTLAKYCYRGIQAPDDTFYKTFEFKGTKFGFIPNLSQLKTGEFVDLDDWYSEGIIKNLHKIMSVLYRELKWTKDFLGEFRWDIEEYDSNTHKAQSEAFKELPFKYVTGASVFFWRFGKEFMTDMLTSLTHQEKESMKKTNPNLSIQTFLKDLENIGSGGLSSILSQTTNSTI